MNSLKFMNYTKTYWENWKKESLNGKYGTAWFDGLNIPSAAGGELVSVPLTPLAGRLEFLQR